MIGLGFLVLIVVLLFWVVGMYNGLVRLRKQVDNAWSQIDVQLKRRHDLIPNLVETVKGYAKHERELLENVTRARARAIESRAEGPAAQIQAETSLGARCEASWSRSRPIPISRPTRTSSPSRRS